MARFSKATAEVTGAAANLKANVMRIER